VVSSPRGENVALFRHCVAQCLRNVLNLFFTHARGKRQRQAAVSRSLGIVQLAPYVDRGMRNRILQVLRAAGVGCQAYFPAIHRQPFLQDLIHLPFGRLLDTETAADRCLALPFSSCMQEEQIQYVAGALRNAVAEECDVLAALAGKDHNLRKQPAGESLQERV